MAIKKNGKQPRESAKEGPKALRVHQQQAESKADTLAHTALRPTVQAALTLLDYNKTFGEMSVNTLIDDLGKQCGLANKGDLSRAEALLTAQAHTLDAIFNNLARRAALNMGQYVNAAETYLRLALKAQSQCRATLETLAEIKNPQPVAFVRQANIAHGSQQVNNGIAPPGETSCARETENQQNKLLEGKNGERLDTAAAGKAASFDPEMATLGAIDRTEDARR